MLPLAEAGDDGPGCRDAGTGLDFADEAAEGLAAVFRSLGFDDRSLGSEIDGEGAEGPRPQGNGRAHQGDGNVGRQQGGQAGQGSLVAADAVQQQHEAPDGTVGGVQAIGKGQIVDEGRQGVAGHGGGNKIRWTMAAL